MAKKYDERPNGLGLLKQHIKNKAPQRLYIFHGEEVFLSQQHAVAQRALALLNIQNMLLHRV